MSKDLKKVKEIAMGMYRKDIVGTGNSQYEDLAMEAFLISLRNIKDASVVGMSERARGKAYRQPLCGPVVSLVPLLQPRTHPILFYMSGKEVVILLSENHCEAYSGC